MKFSFKKTRWVILLTLVILAAFLAGGIILKNFFFEEEPSVVSSPEEEKEEMKKIKEITSSEKRKIAESVVPEGSIEEDNGLFYETYDLKKDGNLEMIVSTCFKDLPTGRSCVGWVGIFELFEDQKFQKVGELYFNELGIFSSIDHIPSIEEGQPPLDIKGDGEKEILISFSHGAYTNQYFILDIDWEKGELSSLEGRDKKGEVISPFVLSSGASAMHVQSFEIKNLDEDKAMEIIEHQCNYHYEKEEKICENKVYKWDGSYLSYHEELSKKINQE